MRKIPAAIVLTICAVLLVVTVVGGILGGSRSAATAAAPITPAEPTAEPAAPGGPAPGSPAPGSPAPGGPAPDSPAPGSPAPGSAAPVSVAFLGDGYTAQTRVGGQGPANYTSILAGRDGWRTVTNDSVFGSGYVAGPALQTRLDRIVAGAPQLVVVTAGRADDQSDPAAVGAAATRLYQDLRTRLPQAKVVVIGPMWLGDADVPRGVLAARDAIRTAATQANLPFTDPITERWFINRDETGTTLNNLTVNDLGHQRLADLVGDTLRRDGVGPR